MRYDKEVLFCRTQGETYNPKTGDYEDGEVEETRVLASVMDTREESMRLVYGKVKQGSLTIQIQNHYDEPYDYIVYDGKEYQVDYTRRFRTKQTFIVSGKA